MDVVGERSKGKRRALCELAGGDVIEFDGELWLVLYRSHSDENCWIANIRSGRQIVLVDNPEVTLVEATMTITRA